MEGGLVRRYIDTSL